METLEKDIASIWSNPCIYVADLGAYNAGKLIGKWLDLTTFEEVGDLQNEIDKIACSSGYGDEWAIHDYSNMPSSLGENPDLEKVLEIAELIKEHSFNVVDAFINIFSYDDLDNLEDSYCGEWDSFKAFSDDIFDECYLHDVPDHIQNYIDYEGFSKDLSMDYYEADNPASYGVFVFRSY